MEAEQCASKQPTDQWRNQRGNKKMPKDKWKWKHHDPKPMRCSQSCSKREVYSNSSLSQETRRISHKIPNFTVKADRERRISKTQS